VRALALEKRDADDRPSFHPQEESLCTRITVPRILGAAWRNGAYKVVCSAVFLLCMRIGKSVPLPLGVTVHVSAAAAAAAASMKKERGRRAGDDLAPSTAAGIK
jgi:hypothetical protein